MGLNKAGPFKPNYYRLVSSSGFWHECDWSIVCVCLLVLPTYCGSVSATKNHWTSNVALTSTCDTHSALHTFTSIKKKKEKCQLPFLDFVL